MSMSLKLVCSPHSTAANSTLVGEINGRIDLPIREENEKKAGSTHLNSLLVNKSETVVRFLLRSIIYARFPNYFFILTCFGHVFICQMSHMVESKGLHLKVENSP